MIINIHGYNGKGNNSKFEWLKEHFPAETIISPTLNHGGGITPSLSKLKYEMFMHGYDRKDGTKKILIATSMGCFAGYILHTNYGFDKAIFLNPCFLPFLHLSGDDRKEFVLKDYVKQFEKNFFDWDEGEDKFINRTVHIVYGNKDERINHKIETVPLMPYNFKNWHEVDTFHDIHITGEVEKTVLDILSQ